MNFGQALQGLLSGEYVTISCDTWNGKGMHVFCVHRPCFDVLEEKVTAPVLPDRDHSDLREANPCLALRGADGRVTLGWTPSQRDLFNNDWAGKEGKNAVQECSVNKEGPSFGTSTQAFGRSCYIYIDEPPPLSPLQRFTRDLDRYATLQRKVDREGVSAAELLELGSLYRSLLDLVGPSTK